MNATNTTTTTNANANNSTLADTIAILESFTTGQGKTEGLADKFIIDGLTVNYTAVGMSFTFQSEAHKNSLLTMLLYNNLKDKSADYLTGYFSHMASGAFLSLNHKSDNPSVKSDLLAPYKTIFDLVGVTKVEKTKGSKFYWLHIDNVDDSTVMILSNDGFTNITPFLTGIKVGGLKVELPSTN